MGNLIRKFFLLCKRASKADIVKVFSFTAISTLIKMTTGLISVKIIASLIGPSGVALVGQLNNFASIAMALSSGGINNGVTKYIAEYKKDEYQVKNYLSTALKITIVCSLFTGLLMILLSSYLSNAVMLSSEYNYIFIVFGFTVLLYALNSLLISILNGTKEFKKYVVINIANSIVGLLFALFFVYTLGLKGVLISVVTYQSVMFFVTFSMLKKLPWVKWRYFKEKLDVKVVRKLLQYTLMTLVTAATVPISQMILRTYIISQISLVEAGWWEAMNRISGAYLMVITTSFSVYYLPRLSELTDKIELRREVFKAYKLIIPMLLVCFLLIYLLRFYVISILFTSDFLSMENLFLWQLMGDFFKICSWLLAFLMVAKSMMKVFISTEIIFAITFLVLGETFIDLNGVVGITQAYFINYLCYTITLIFFFRKLLFS